jgi:hypothetical protein
MDGRLTMDQSEAVQFVLDEADSAKDPEGWLLDRILADESSPLPGAAEIFQHALRTLYERDTEVLP